MECFHPELCRKLDITLPNPFPDTTQPSTVRPLRGRLDVESHLTVPVASRSFRSAIHAAGHQFQWVGSQLQDRMRRPAIFLAALMNGSVLGFGPRALRLFALSSMILLGLYKGRAMENPGGWQWPPSRQYHVANYKLVLKFDQQKSEVVGTEFITLRPLAARFHQFYLDSSELRIDSVTLEEPPAKPAPLSYTTQGSQLRVTLDREYDAASSLTIRIRYQGHPRTGLYFVHPTSNYPNAPNEIYSQGEPEFNHFWFPCWDYPNDMAASETITTVPEGQVVVSNGKLLSVKHAFGFVTYDWIESIPHSSYLISVAVGPWRKVSDEYQGKPVDYYVPRFTDEATARRSFHLTTDMIGFFSRMTGVSYPYEKYSQTTVYDFPFGGQENVSATTLTDSTLHGERADLDYPSTALVSHELGQQWCGDYVQGRDWANIWLNEGCATYLDALYTQYRAGNDEYRFEIYQDQLTEQAHTRAVVDRHYSDPMQMFDEVTHEKGAAVLDMLRFILDGSGAVSRTASLEEPLFRALHYYLTTHRAQCVDTDQLVDSVRSATGQELDWFFHEWIFMAGHPSYRVSADYDLDRRAERLIVTQTQHVDSVTPIFDMPIEVVFYGAEGQRVETVIRDSFERQEFNMPLDFRPEWVDFDPDDFIDKTLQFEQPLRSMILSAEKDPSMMSRLWAVQQLGIKGKADSSAAIETLTRVLAQDRFHGVRSAAAESLARLQNGAAKGALLSAWPEPDSRVRTSVISALGTYGSDPDAFAAIVDALQNDPSYAVQAAAARQIGKTRDAGSVEILKRAAGQNPEFHVMLAILDGLANSSSPLATDVLLGKAEPGVPKRIRVRALNALAGTKAAKESVNRRELISVSAAALSDSFFPLREAGEEIIGAFKLAEFRSDVEKEAQAAPTLMEREAARASLDRLAGQF
jgi:aminopeptidase N